MARREFEQVVAQTPKKSLQKYQNSISTVLNASAREKVYIYAPSNCIGKVVGMDIQTGASNGTSGTITLSGGYENVNDKFMYQCNYVDQMWLRCNQISLNSGSTAPTLCFPVVAQLPTVLADFYFDDVTPLYIAVYNGTNSTITMTRNYNIEYLVEGVAK